MAELTPQRAAEAHELLKRLLRREKANTRRLRQVLEELTELAEEREDLDQRVGDVIYSQLDDSQDQELVMLALEGLDMEQLLTIIGRSGRPKGQLQVIMERFRYIRDARVHGRGREENAERDRSHIVLGVGGAGGSRSSYRAADGSYITETICWPSGGNASGGGSAGSAGA